MKQARNFRAAGISVLAEGRHVFTVPVDLWAFLSDYIYANQIESLRLWSCGPAREEMSKDPHYP